MSSTTNFQPDWACPPGDTIRDFLQERDWSQAKFAESLGTSLENANNLLNGAAKITDEIATQLTEVLGASTDFWLSREAQFRQSQARIADNEQWVRSFPTKDMARYSWLQAKEDVQDKIAACLEYFDVASVGDWFKRYEGSHRLAAFRTSPTFDSNEGATLAWLRKGEIDASNIDCANWNIEKFHATLTSIRQLTRVKAPEVFLPELRRLSAECGVAFVLARAPSGCRASGATKFLSTDKALLMLSGRYLSDDHFWFTFFHEAAHLVLHSAHKLFLEGCDPDGQDKEEEEANEFAANLLIPPKHKDEMQELPLNGRAVMRFARKIGISPGIVVGQMQYLGKFSHRALNNLKVRYRWD